MPYRKAATTISETTGQTISSNTAWNVTQQIGMDIQQEEEKLIKEMKKEQPAGEEESKVLFQEADGVYINIQENKKKAKSQEIKLATVYTGWVNNGKDLADKLVYGGIEQAKEFSEKTEALIQSVFNIDETELRILNGDGAKWIKNSCEGNRIYQLDRFHIKKEIKRCITNKKIMSRIIGRFNNSDYNGMMEDIETYVNSIDDGTNSNSYKLATQLYKYLSNNYDGLSSWQEQVETVPEAPAGIVYKNMGVQENQNCSLVTNRMKGRKMRWSVEGANNLVKLIYMRENGDLDRIIEDRDGRLDIPQNINIREILPSAKVNKKLVKGSKYVDIFNATVPLLAYSNVGHTSTLRNIVNI